MKIILSTALLIAVTLLFSCSNSNNDTHSNAAMAANPIEVTYTPPLGWTKIQTDTVVSYQPEEQNATVAVVNITTATNAEDAATQAWQLYKPSFNREIRVNTPRDADGGWHEKRRIVYVTTLAENKRVLAYTHEHDGYYKVVLIDSDAGTLNKRGAAIGELLDSMKVAGYQPEDLSGKTAKSLTDKEVEELIAFIHSAAKSLNIPGVGVALSQNGKVLYQGGVGLANVEKQQPVTADTLFMVASNTKGMTTLLLAKLVELGKLDWQDPVIKHYPAFKLGDEATTKSILIEHLVCACTGLPRRDLGWLFNNSQTTPAKSVFDDLATTSPTSEFGKIFQYSNEMAAAAGYVAGHVAYPSMEVGAAYDKAMRELIFEPLGMNNTLFSMDKALSKKHAHPYADDLDGNATPIEQSKLRGFNHTIYAYRPAGAAWSTPADMIKYVQNELSEGVGPNGQRLFAQTELLKRRQTYVATGENQGYGMGLSSEEMAGIYILSHGGSLAGYKSNFYALPKANVGLVILTNSDEGWAISNPVKRKLVELLFDAESKAANQIAIAAERKTLNKESLQKEFTYPGETSILQNLASTYHNDVLGEIRVYQEDGKTYLDPGVWRTEIGTKENVDNTTTLVAVAPFLLGYEFLVGEENGVKTLTTKYAQDSYTFVGRGN